MSSILDILGGNSDLESEEEETMVDSKQIVEHEIKKDLSESPVSDSKERKLESDAEKEKMKVEHAREGDASNDPLEISTSQCFYFSKILLLIWCFVIGYFLRSNILFHFWFYFLASSIFFTFFLGSAFAKVILFVHQ
uniref:Transmembrane protein n=1 Tax=Ascaris lumbricoides TaxID=6252 RepID=A0A0M3HHA8_ASCLU